MGQAPVSAPIVQCPPPVVRPIQQICLHVEFRMSRLIHIYTANAARAEEAAPWTHHFISHATGLHGE